MRRLVYPIGIFLLLLSVFGLFRFLQFDPASAALTLTNKLQHIFKGSKIRIGNLDNDWKTPFFLTSRDLKIEIGRSELRAKKGFVPVTLKDILTGRFDPKLFDLNECVMSLQSLEDALRFLGNPLSPVELSSFINSHSDDFIIQSSRAEIQMPRLNTAFWLDRLLWRHQGTFMTLEARVAGSPLGGMDFSASADFARQLLMITFQRKNLPVGKMEIFNNSLGPKYRFQSNFSDLNPAAILPASMNLPILLEGSMKGSVHSSGLLSSLEGSDFDLLLEGQRGALKNINLPYVVLASLSRIPVFAHLMEGEWGGKLFQAPDTPFETANIQILRQAQALEVRHIGFSSQEFEMGISGEQVPAAAGQLNLKGEILFKGSFAVRLFEHEPFIEALGRKDGIFIPFFIRGTFSEPIIEADLSYVTGQILKHQRDEIAAKGINSINQFVESR